MGKHRMLGPVHGLLGLALAAIVLLTRSASAQAVVRPDRLPAFGRSIAGTDDSTALVLNPANLAFLPSYEFRWQGSYLKDDLVQPYQGHAFSFAFPLPFRLATGLRLDLVNPPVGAFGPGSADNYQWLTWGLAFAPTESFSIGASLQRSYSRGPVASSLGSYSVAATTRPFDHFGLSIVGQHINGPLVGQDVRRLEALGVSNVSLGPSVDTAAVIRPLGTSAIEIGLEGRYLAEPEVWVPRGTLGVDVPYVGRLRGEFSMIDPTESDRSWMATASLALHLNTLQGSSEIEGGMVTGDSLGQSGSYNFYNSVAFRGFREPAGFDPRRYAIRVRIEDTPSARGHVALLRTLWSLRDEDRVDAVVFELRTSPAGSLARVEELRDAVYQLRKSGKRVLCHLEDASGSALYLCAAADRILVNPAGGIRFAGLRTRHFYFKGLLDKIGVRADFVRIGKHKSAPEQFTRTGASDTARADKIDLLQQYERYFMHDIAFGRNLDVSALRETIAHGPFIAPEARRAGLVDGYAYDDQLGGKVEDLVGRSVALVDDDRAEVAPERFGKQRKVAIVYVEGDIIDGRSRTIPLVGMRLAGSYTLAETLKQVREDPFVSAVVLRIESPGGSSMAADVIWRQVQLTAKAKPVVVSMGAVAASGGYYVAAPATRIFANPLSITGSIGVFYGKADVSELLRKIGVNVEVYKTSPRADAESIFRPFTREEHRELQRKVWQFYDTFLGRVATGRGMSKREVDAIGRGRVWTGAQAKERGLVDELGGLREALAHARKLAGLRDDAPIIELPKIQTSLLGRLLGIEGIRSSAVPPLPPGLVDAARAMAPFMVHPADKPLMRLEVVEVTP